MTSTRIVVGIDPEPTVDREPVRMFTMLQGVALILVTALVSVALTLWFTGDDADFNDVDVGFLSDMTTHHQGAISLSFAYLPRENDPIVGHTAREVILTQVGEIGSMNNFLHEAGDQADTVQGDDIAMEWMGAPVDPKDMPGMASAADYDELRAAAGIAADDQFTRLMIGHHAAGAAMADYAVEHGENDAVRKFAEKIARNQRIEIIELNDRRELLGITPIDPPTDIEHEGHQ